MFIKPFPKYNRTTKQRYTVYRLCESYRLNGYIRHRTIIGLGKLEELETVEQKKLLASRIECAQTHTKRSGLVRLIHISELAVIKMVGCKQNESKWKETSCYR